MSYTSNASDASTPADNAGARYGAPEIRALKARVNTIRTELTTAQSSIAALLTDVADIDSLLGELQQDFTELSGTVTGISEGLGTASSAISSIAAYLSSRRVIAKVEVISTATSGTFTSPTFSTGSGTLLVIASGRNAVYNLQYPSPAQVSARLHTVTSGQAIAYSTTSADTVVNGVTYAKPTVVGNSITTEHLGFAVLVWLELR